MCYSCRYVKDGYKLWVVLKKCFCVISYVITTESEVSSFFLYLIKDNWDDKEAKRFLIRSLKEKLMHLPRSSFSISKNPHGQNIFHFHQNNP